MSISPDMMARYQATARRREQERERARKARHARAWEVAHAAAAMLKKEFGATRVVAFGSLLDEERFSEWSDIDLAAWDVEDYFLAVARLQDLNPDFKIDLVAVPHCNPTLLERIKREGVEL